MNKLKQLEGDAVSLLTSAHDRLGGMLDVGSDTILQKLRHQPDDLGEVCRDDEGGNGSSGNASTRAVFCLGRFCRARRPAPFW